VVCFTAFLKACIHPKISSAIHVLWWQLLVVTETSFVDSTPIGVKHGSVGCWLGYLLLLGNLSSSSYVKDELM
jgi:hypothetical protein